MQASNAFIAGGDRLVVQFGACFAVIDEEGSPVEFDQQAGDWWWAGASQPPPPNL